MSSKPDRAPLRVLLPVPLGWAALSLLLAVARGPFYQAQWTDPEYDYLLNALQVAHGEPPYQIDHPGTPLQVLGAWVVRVVDVVAPGARGETLTDRVLLDPEHYLWPLQGALVVLCGLALAAAGALAWRATGRAADAWLCQLVPFLSLQALWFSFRMTPDLPLLSIGLLLGGALVWAVEAGDAPRAAVLLGVLWGVGTACKVTFAVTGLAAVAALPGWRPRLRFAATAAVSFALCLVPIRGSLGRLGHWLVTMVTHSGEYGRGPATVVDWATWRGGLARMPWHEPILLPLVLAAFLVALAVLRRADDRRVRARANVVLAIAAAQIVLVLVIAKQPRAHYLIPGVALAGAALALGRALVWERVVRWRWHGPLAAVLVLALAALLVRRVVQIAGRLDAIRRNSAQAAAVAAADDARLVRGVRIPAPPSALRHGDEYAGGRYGADLRRLYPHFAMWDWAGLHRFGQPVGLLEFLDEGSDGFSFRSFVNTEFPGAPLSGGSWRRERLATFERHALERVWVPAVDAEPPEAFAGFVDARGLRGLEGPYPQLGLPTPVRWGLRPSTALTFLSPGGEIALVLEGQGYGATPTRVGVFLEGRPLGVLEFPTSPGFGRQSLRFTASPGLRELSLVYASPEYDATGFGVLYRRLSLRLKRAEDPTAPADDRKPRAPSGVTGPRYDPRMIEAR